MPTITPLPVDDPDAHALLADLLAEQAEGLAVRHFAEERARLVIVQVLID